MKQNQVGAESQDVERKRDKSVVLTPRVVILLTLSSIAVAYMNMGHPAEGAGYFPGLPNAWIPSATGVLAVFVMSLIAFRVKRVAAALKLDLSKAEMMALYIGIAFVSVMTGSRTLSYIVSYVGMVPYMYLTDSSQYAQVGEFISPSLLVWDLNALRGLQLGDAVVPWSVWITPILLWFLIYTAIFFLLFCIGALFYDRWSRVEHLGFPLAMPLMILTEAIDKKSQRSIKQFSFENPIFLVGLGIPIFLHLWGTLRGFMPGIPDIPLGFSFESLFDSQSILGQAVRVWPGTHFTVTPMIVGISYFVPSDFTFSAWFFYYIVHRTVGNSLIISSGLQASIWDQWEPQARGGYIALSIYLLWMARHDVMKYIRSAFGKSSDERFEARTALPPKVLVFGGTLCVIFLLVSGAMLLSVSPWFMLFNLFWLFCVAVFHARCRTEVGSPLTFTSPLTTMMLTGWFGVKDKYVGSLFGLRAISHQGAGDYPSTSGWVMEGLRLADESKAKRSSMMYIMLLALLLTFVVGIPIALKTFYKYGLSVGIGQYISQRPVWDIAPMYEASPTPYIWRFTAVGAIVTGIFSVMRSHYTWWPFHPLGYLLGAQPTFCNSTAPASFLIGWILKVTILRWGGGSLYEKVKPFFMGLLLGYPLGMIIPIVCQFVTMYVSF